MLTPLLTSSVFLSFRFDHGLLNLLVTRSSMSVSRDLSWLVAQSCSCLTMSSCALLGLPTS
jgi:hypothetical protein